MHHSRNLDAEYTGQNMKAPKAEPISGKIIYFDKNKDLQIKVKPQLSEFTNNSQR